MAPYMDPLSQSLAQAGIPSITPAYRRRDRRRADPFEPRIAAEDESTLLQDLGGGVVGGLSAVGNLLDLPGSMVRDVLSQGTSAPQNPFDQLLSPFSDRNRITGRDLLRGYNMVQGPDTWANWGAGLAVDIATDPLTYLTLGGAPTLTAAGKAAKTSGTLARGIGGQIAARQRGLAALTLPFATEGVPIGFGAGAQRVGNALDAVGGAIRYGKIPGTNVSPGAIAASLFDSRMQGVTDPDVQRGLAEPLAPARDLARVAGREATARDVEILRGSGLDMNDREVWRRIRSVAEQPRAPFGPAQNLPVYPQPGWDANLGAASMMPEFVAEHADILADQPTMEVIDRFQHEFRDLLDEGQSYGIEKSALEDELALYFTRHKSEAPGAGTASVRTHGAMRAEDLRREEILKNIVGNTRTIQQIAMDPQVDALIANVREKNLTPDDLAVMIQQAYPNKVATFGYVGTNPAAGLNQYYRKQLTTSQLNPKFIENAEKLRSFAKWLMETPDPLRRAGVFANMPFFDANTARLNLRDQVEVAKGVQHYLATGDVIGGTAVESGTMELGELLGQLGMGAKTGKELTAIQRINATRAAQNLPSVTDKHRIPLEIANQILKYNDGFRTPSNVNFLVSGLDTATNLFKSGVTQLWPAYHVRNLISSQFQNMVNGWWSPGAVRDANTILRGETVRDAVQIPVVRWLLRYHGRPETSAEATKLLRELASGHEVLGAYEGIMGDVAGASASGAGALRERGWQELLGAVPGAVPHKWGNVARQAIGATPDTNWNVLAMRGVAGREATEFGPAKAAEGIGHYVEGLARIGPMIHRLRRMRVPTGPQAAELIRRQIREAAEEIGAAQVVYGGRSYTPIERDILKRLIPFYSFSSRMMPWTLRHLAERPGGRLAQTIRATNRAKDPTEVTPDYVAETAAIPVHDTPLQHLFGSPGDGGRRYLTGFGLMHEDPMSFFGKGVGGAGLEVLSRLNPLAKVPLQMSTGQSFFQQGPLGGRPLEDLDPTVGRTLANIKQIVTGVPQEGPVRYPGSSTVEVMMETLPIARAATTLRQITDTRKNAPTIAANVLTGVRFADVSPANRDAIIRERAQAFERRNLGANLFETTYVPDWLEAQLSDSERAMLERINAMKRELVRRRRVRKMELERAKAAQ